MLSEEDRQHAARLGREGHAPEAIARAIAARVAAREAEIDRRDFEDLAARGMADGPVPP
jgi:hypothetical protein